MIIDEIKAILREKEGYFNNFEILKHELEGKIMKK